MLVQDDWPLIKTSLTSDFRNGTKDTLKLLSISIEDKAASQFALSKPKISLEGQFSTQNVITSQTVTVLPGMTFYFTLTFTPR